jgi:hypothetical protein
MCHKGKNNTFPEEEEEKEEDTQAVVISSDTERERERTHHAGLRAQILPSPSVDGAASCVFQFQIRAKTTSFVGTLESTTGPPVLTPVAAMMKRQDRTRTRNTLSDIVPASSAIVPTIILTYTLDYLPTSVFFKDS